VIKMPREKFDIPDENIFEWIEENFKLGGFANYDREQVVAFMGFNPSQVQFTLFIVLLMSFI
jgi:hypothetical protein